MAIIDNDEKYAAKLMEFINQVNNTIFNASAFTKASTYLSYAAEHKNVILLCIEEYIDNILDGDKDILTENIFILSKTNQSNEKYQSIYKYKSASDIYKEISCICNSSLKDENKQADKAETEIIGILSLFRENICLFFGVLLADLYGESYKTLYVSFDPFFNPKIFGQEECNMGITESIYFLRQNTDNAANHILRYIISSKDFDIIGGYSYWADGTEISIEEAVHMIGRFINLNSYEKIIIDYGGFYRMTDGLIKLCHKILIPKPQDEYEDERLKVFLKQAALSGNSLVGQAEYIDLSYGDSINLNRYSIEGLRESTLYGIVSRSVGKMNR